MRPLDLTHRPTDRPLEGRVAALPAPQPRWLTPSRLLRSALSPELRGRVSGVGGAYVGPGSRYVQPATDEPAKSPGRTHHGKRRRAPGFQVGPPPTPTAFLALGGGGGCGSHPSGPSSPRHRGGSLSPKTEGPDGDSKRGRALHYSDSKCSAFGGRYPSTMTP